MDREQMIAHLILHGWEPVESRTHWLGVEHPEKGLVYAGGVTNHRVTYYSRWSDIGMFRATWDAIEFMIPAIGEFIARENL